MLTKNGKNNRIMYVVVIAVVLLAVAAAGFFAKKYFDLKANPGLASQEEATRLTEAVGKLYQLPKDETPIVGKVQDKQKLKDQPFFKNAENGDDLLIYQKSKIAIIYRANQNKLINVGPIAIDAAAGQSATTSVKVINAAAKVDAANKAVATLGGIAGVKVDTAIEVAKNKNIVRTTVVDITGTKTEQTKQIAEALGAVVGSLPAGESKPGADIAVFMSAY